VRKSGILMHISSLPGKYGCGAFGTSAYQFVDLLSDCGFSLWQTLPFSWPDEYGSPYKSLSAFAGNPYLIDLDSLYLAGLVTQEELEKACQLTPYRCEFDRLKEERLPLLREAAKRVSENDRHKIVSFMKDHPPIQDFCLFMATKEANQGKSWLEFDFSVSPDPKELFFHQFLQYTFFEQWFRLKAYANQKGIEIIGDLPIYLDLDSSDVWLQRKNFLLDEKGKPIGVAGVPPDYFSPDGQLWGNPLYDWEYMKKDNYTWWRNRIAWQLTLFDGIRIDHFRAFSSYWAVPAGAKTAKEGKWRQGPGIPFVNCLKEEANGKLILAEDLGDIDQGVKKLLRRSGLPGMRVFQFAFLSEENVHQPHCYEKNCVAYSGTHDNNTLLGFLWESSDEEKKRILDYIGYPVSDWKNSCPAMLKTLLRSPANWVIFPVQDILGYGSDTRMNTPGKPDGNWAFRVTDEQLASIDRNYWKAENHRFGRM
jgi:4-alpha-glucanotransferase